jgi:EAL domain-containing protein (putative c-di-GMP-specific phosphodiesterase class I)/DNA-binding CsgD family transcriptional regulator
MRLLVFDDDQAIGRLIVRVATMAGLTATAVTDPDAFQRDLTDAPPDIIMLDLQLGQTDGVEQLRLLAQRHYGGAIIMMSGFDARVLTTTAMVARNLDLNIAATLNKPIDIAALEAIIARLRSIQEPLSAERLLTAIRNDELILELQPIVRSGTRALTKLEALVRWDHPHLGQLPPADFVPLAETDHEAIDALTEWVIGAAVDAWRILRQLGVSVPITVNVSTLNLHDLTLPDRVARRLAAAGMPAEALCLELTETAASRDTARMMDILTRVRLKGIELAIDDFGTGYSSLKALRQLPFSVIKIDRSFVSDMVSSADSRTIVKSIIDLASNMNMSTIAEGVETEETARMLELMRAGALQGYLIARPMPVEEIPAWLTVWNKTNAASAARPVIPDRARATAGDAAAGIPIAALATVGADQSPPAATQPADEPPALSECQVPALSECQVEVMRLLTEGCSVKEIARRLGLGAETVKIHLSRAYASLGARDRVEAIMRASPRLEQSVTEPVASGDPPLAPLSAYAD